jgi:hypothetical protein
MNQDLFDLAKILDSVTIRSTWGKYPARRHNKYIIRAILRNKKKNVFKKYIEESFGAS